MNGSISNIPAGYTVEVRDLVVGTQYMVEERDREIPKGFTRCDGDGYVRTDLSEGDYIYYTSGGVYDKHLLADDNTTTAEPVRDTIRSKTESPRIDIRNQEGWGLTAKKIWTDKDFMTHDPIYMAVYFKESDESLSLYDGSVRMLENGDSEIYWFFPDLKVGEDTYAFDKFVIREVSLNVPDGEDPDDHISTDNNGKVTYDEYVSGVCIGDGETLAIGGTPAGGSHMEGFEYTVSYDAGDPTGHNELIRTDTITNSRPGIRIVKKDWNGAPLAGATFTLKYSGGTDVSAESYTSDSDGLVTIAYLNAGASYTLDEIRTPAGYVKMDSSVTITVSKDDEGNDVFGITDPAGCTVFTAATDTAMAELTVKNRAVQELKIIKVDSSDTEIRLEGVEFALYDQVSDNNGNLRKDYFPKPGYESLLTDSGGELPKITMGLGAGTYYLEEIRAADGYKKLANDLCFTIGADGTVTIVNDGYKNWLTVSHPEQGVVSYEIAVENAPLGVTFRKTDEKGELLTGSKFTLCALATDSDVWEAVNDHGIAGGVLDLTDSAELNITNVQNGRYRLTETIAPAGYVIRTVHIYFTVSDGALTLTDENGEACAYSLVHLEDDDTTIVVANTPGQPLPSTGGIGTHLFTALGAITLALSVILFVCEMHKRKRSGSEGQN